MERYFFYAYYADYLRNSGQLEIYEFSNIISLTQNFERVELTDTGYIFHNVIVMEDGIVQFDKKTFFVSDRYVLYTIIRKLGRLRKVIPKAQLAKAFFNVWKLF